MLHLKKSWLSRVEQSVLLGFSLLLFAVNHVRAQEKIDFFFKTGKAELEKVEQNRFEQFIQNHKNGKIISISGFTDEVGTSQNNQELAAARVGFVVELLNKRMAIRDDFRTNSFGEKFALGQGENALNRKVSILYLKEVDVSREDEILGLKPSEVVKKNTEMPRFPTQLRFQNINGSVSEYQLDTLAMKSIFVAKKGEKLKLKNVEFYINTFVIVPDSRAALYELLSVMQAKPELNVEIQGHICCMPSDKQDLSTKRAKAIVNFLTANGIERERLTYKGFGSTAPIFTIPEASEQQRAANRRVEVEIISN